ncbi:Betaine aldehyde dehydrogenase (plasmid) [Peribacillus frigoritolerans]|uniref:aldehyde dehydrogenase family protein n=1 Tax=Peribacillus frigoritolerans TaxID=450367 RepID=UPI0030CEA52B
MKKLLEKCDQLYINGHWLKGEGEKRVLSNPANEEFLTEIHEASVEQVELAIQAAFDAFRTNDWAINKGKRIETLKRIAQRLEDAKDDLTKLEVINTGKPYNEAKLDIDDSIACLRYYVDLIVEKQPRRIKMEDGSVSKVHKEPIGVCSLIVPWNFPFLLGMWKIAPALAAGNTIVFKPSEITPLSSILFTELLDQCDVPDGVFNLVLGAGKGPGEALVTSDKVDKVSFTGGSETGRKVIELCAQSFKRVSLELGGKSPFLIFDDVDADLAAELAIYGAFLNQGEVCVASSRLLVHENLYETFLGKLNEKLQKLRIGDPFDENTEMGAIISKEHLAKIERYISIGKEEGATLLFGGERLNRKGLFITPAVFTNVKQNMRIVQEEIFGPVVTVQSFRTEKEAIELANDTKFGLAAGILSGNQERAQKIAGELKAGMIWINSYHTPYVEAPWGGYKQSGIGRELGPEGLDGFLETKHVNTQKSVESLGWYKF